MGGYVCGGFLRAVRRVAVSASVRAGVVCADVCGRRAAAMRALVFVFCPEDGAACDFFYQRGVYAVCVVYAELFEVYILGAAFERYAAHLRHRREFAGERELFAFVRRAEAEFLRGAAHAAVYVEVAEYAAAREAIEGARKFLKVPQMEVHVVTLADEQRVASPYHALGAYRLGEAAEGQYYFLLFVWHAGLDVRAVWRDGELEIICVARELREARQERRWVLSPKDYRADIFRTHAHTPLLLRIHRIARDGEPFAHAAHEPFAPMRRYVRAAARAYYHRHARVTERRSRASRCL